MIDLSDFYLFCLMHHIIRIMQDYVDLCLMRLYQTYHIKSVRRNLWMCGWRSLNSLVMYDNNFVVWVVVEQLRFGNQNL